MSGTWAVVVSRTEPDAKSRLSSVLAPETRSALAVAMLRDVLGALRQADLAGIVAVLAPSMSDVDGYVAVEDPGAGLNAAVTAGVRAAMNAGGDAVLVMPGDLPLLRAHDVATLLAKAEADAERAVVVALDRHGTGTNALLLRPADVISPAFGPDSGARHLAAAHEAGVAARGVTLDRVALDVDTPDDLRELLQRRVGGQTGAVLGQIAAR